MLSIILVLSASALAAASPPPSRLSAHQRRMEVQTPPEMEKQKYMMGKVSVTYNATDLNAQNMAWIAKVGIDGGKYDMMLDSMLSVTWMYSPADPFKCEQEMNAFSGLDLPSCYTMKGGKMLEGLHPFMLNHTGPGRYGASGSRAVVQTITCPESSSVKFPAAIGLVDNTYNKYGIGSLPTDRLYHGVLGLSKMDKHVFELGEKKAHIYQSPFNNASEWSYFTTYFNHMADDDKIYLGLEYENPADRVEPLTTLPSGGDMWSVTADASWKVKVWEQVMIGNKSENMETQFNTPFPVANMAATGNVHLDLGSGTTYVDLNTAKMIYKAFDGSCIYKPDDTRMMPMMMDMGYPIYHRTPTCTLPVKISLNTTSGESWVEPIKSGRFSLPFGGTDIKIDPMTMIDLIEGPPCFRWGNQGHSMDTDKGGEGGMKTAKRDMVTQKGGEGETKTAMMPEVVTCEANAYGTIQPGFSSMDTIGSGMHWKYGDVFFRNAYVKWTTGTNSSIGVAEYAAINGNTTPAPSAAKGRKERKGKYRNTMLRYKKTE